VSRTPNSTLSAATWRPKASTSSVSTSFLLRGLTRLDVDVVPAGSV
jgi:hypothetical protein